MHLLRIVVAALVCHVAAVAPPPSSISPITAAPWLVVTVNGTAVWSAQPAANASGQWVAGTSSPFTLDTISVVSWGGSAVSCVEDVYLVPVAPPQVAAYTWSASLTIGGIGASAFASAATYVARSLASFVGVPPERIAIGATSSFSGGTVLNFTATVLTPEERAAIAAALQDGTDLAPNVGPALALFLQSGMASVTTAALADVTEVFAPMAATPPAPRQSSPPYPPLPPAPVLMEVAGAAIGCALAPTAEGIVMPFHGVVTDVQLYHYPISVSCANAILGNSTTGCAVGPPPAPAPPTPPLPPSPAPAIAIIAVNTMNTGRACGPAIIGHVTLGAAACMYTAALAAQVEGASRGVPAFTGAGAAHWPSIVGIPNGADATFTYSIAYAGRFSVRWRQTLQSPLDALQYPPRVTVLHDGVAVYSATEIGESCSFHDITACGMAITGGTHSITIAVSGPRVFIDAVELVPAASTCVIQAPPIAKAPPPASPHPFAGFVSKPPPMPPLSPPPGAAPIPGSIVRLTIPSDAQASALLGGTVNIATLSSPYVDSSIGAIVSQAFAIHLIEPVPGSETSINMSVLVIAPTYGE